MTFQINVTGGSTEVGPGATLYGAPDGDPDVSEQYDREFVPLTEGTNTETRQFVIDPTLPPREYELIGFVNADGRTGGETELTDDCTIQVLAP